MINRLSFHVDPRDAASDKDEASIQALFRSRMRVLAPTVILVAVPNAGKRTAWEKRQRAREGMVAGFPDMLAMHDGRTAALEFKSGIGILSDKQVDTLNRLVAQRFPVGVFRSADTAVEWLQGHWPDAFEGRMAA
jgi:hypothetical protein